MAHPDLLLLPWARDRRGGRIAGDLDEGRARTSRWSDGRDAAAELAHIACWP